MRCRYASRLSVVNTPLPSALSIKILRRYFVGNFANYLGSFRRGMLILYSLIVVLF